MQTPVTCLVCSDAIGVYEPVLAAHLGDWRETSLAREPDLRRTDAVLVHVACGALLTAPASETVYTPTEGIAPSPEV
jgi:hypothetical protein